MGIITPPEYGGTGWRIVDYTIVVEELARSGFWGLASYFNAVIMYGTDMILHGGNQEQKKYYLPRLCGASCFLPTGITEPDSVRMPQLPHRGR
jgi:alkylation response protein AidB-like acyl-CoA dehydrogenase